MKTKKVKIVANILKEWSRKMLKYRKIQPIAMEIVEGLPRKVKRK